MSAVSLSAPVLEARALSRTFSVGTSFWGARETLRAVDDVSLTLRRGKVSALVGESGSGKSTVARLLSRLYEPTAGSILLENEDVTRIRGRRRMLEYRAQVQMIFQDPFASLNPVKHVGHHLARPLRIHRVVPDEPGARTRARAARDGRARARGRRRREVPARALGRTAPARGDRSGPCRRAEGRARGRADLDARRVDPARDPEPRPRAQGARADRVPVHHARPRERAVRRRRDPRDVQGPDRRARPDRGGAPVPSPRVHEAPAHRRAAARRRAQHRRSGRDAPGRPRSSPRTGGTPTSPRCSSRSGAATSYGERRRSTDDCSARAGAVHAARRLCAGPRRDARARSRRWDTRASSSTTSSGAIPGRCGRCSTSSGSRCAVGTRGSRRSRTASTSCPPSSASWEATG